MELFDQIEEELLVIPKTGISVSLLVRTYDPKEGRGIFTEFTKADGGKKLFLQSSDYLMFKYKDKNNRDIHETVAVSYLCMDTLKRGMQEAEDFMTEAFMENENGNIIVEPAKMSGIKISGMIRNKSILFLPGIDYNAETQTQNPIVTMVLNDSECSGTMPYDIFTQLTEFIKNFNLYASSKLLLNTLISYCNAGAPKNKNEVAEPVYQPKVIPRRGRGS
jgi:hypothetical protein